MITRLSCVRVRGGVSLRGEGQRITGRVVKQLITEEITEMYMYMYVQYVNER